MITFLSIIEECAATDPQKRPDFETILASLESLEAQKDVFVDEQAILSSIQRKGLDSAKNYGKPSKNNNTNETNNININNAGANILSFSGRAYYVEGEDGEDGDELSKMGKLNAPKYEWFLFATSSLNLLKLYIISKIVFTLNEALPGGFGEISFQEACGLTFVLGAK